jgi:hypothetical protein
MDVRERPDYFANFTADSASLMQYAIQKNKGEAL